uniref:Uncharacterized protein n=1 Tax=Anguilla anguilla TaxID=7936 RepID=A0A0E9UE09_ANGAN
MNCASLLFLLNMTRGFQYFLAGPRENRQRTKSTQLPQRMSPL